MPEIGAKPRVPRLQRMALRAVRTFSTPLLPDDYLELINPLWSTRELKGRIERIDHVTDTAAAGKATARANTSASGWTSAASATGGPTR
jgi:hypothetical protein